MSINKAYVRYTQLLIIVASLVSAWVIEYAYGLMPCPICWMQRITLIFMGCILFTEVGLGTRFSLSCFFFLFIIVGMALNLHHQYLISNYDPNASCLPGFDYLLNTFGFLKALKLVLTDTSSSCGDVVFTLFGLNIPQLLILIYIALSILQIVKLRLSS